MALLERANTVVAKPICLRARWRLAPTLFRISTAIFYILCLNHVGVDCRPQSADHHHHNHHNEGRNVHEEGSVRLVGGEVGGTGNALVYHNGEWGAICDDGWNLQSAHIICKSLGFPYALGYTNQAYFGSTTHNIMLDDVRCYGDEPNILECDHAYWGQHNCAKSESAGVFCAPKTLKEKITEKTRPTTETPEIVKTLEPTTTPAPPPTSVPPKTDPPVTPSTQERILRNEVEDTLDVNHINPLNSGSNVEEVVKVLPENVESRPEIRRLDETEEEDVAEFNLGPAVAVGAEEDGNEESDTQTEAEISAPRQEAGESEGADETSTAMIANATDPALAEIFLKKKNIQQQIDESKMRENEFIHGTENEAAPLNDPHHPSPYDVRIVNGRDEKEGRVEVNIGGVWALICSDNWNLLEARVACKQAGLGYAKMAAKGTYFGGSTMPKVIQGLRCDGTEDRLSDCYHERVGDVMCPEVQFIAGVVCAFELPDLVPNDTLLETSTYLQDAPLDYLTCAMEEGCAASTAYTIVKKFPHSYGSHRRRLLRFSSSTWNYGTADFRPFIPKNSWEWHNCHMHYHSMEIFAVYDLLDHNHNRVAEGHKASFCLEDVECLPGKEKRYECVGYSDQGISVGCADTYLHSIDCQWIDITDLKIGKYLFRVHINPMFKVAELDYENNAASCDLIYTGYTAEVKNCAIGRGDHLPHRN